MHGKNTFPFLSNVAHTNNDGDNKMSLPAIFPVELNHRTNRRHALVDKEGRCAGWCGWISAVFISTDSILDSHDASPSLFKQELSILKHFIHIHFILLCLVSGPNKSTTRANAAYLKLHYYCSRNEYISFILHIAIFINTWTPLEQTHLSKIHQEKGCMKYYSSSRSPPAVTQAENTEIKKVTTMLKYSHGASKVSKPSLVPRELRNKSRRGQKELSKSSKRRHCEYDCNMEHSQFVPGRLQTLKRIVRYTPGVTLKLRNGNSVGILRVPSRWTYCPRYE